MRLRDKVHDLGVEMVVLRRDHKRFDAALGELRDWTRELQRQVDGMTHAEEVAQKVTAALSAQRKHYWNLPRAVGASVGTLAVLVAAQLIVHLLLQGHP